MKLGVGVAREMQIDLQQPLVVASIVQDGGELSVRRLDIHSEKLPPARRGA